MNGRAAERPGWESLVQTAVLSTPTPHLRQLSDKQLGPADGHTLSFSLITAVTSQWRSPGCVTCGTPASQQPTMGPMRKWGPQILPNVSTDSPRACGDLEGGGRCLALTLDSLESSVPIDRDFLKSSGMTPSMSTWGAPAKCRGQRQGTAPSPWGVERAGHRSARPCDSPLRRGPKVPAAPRHLAGRGTHTGPWALNAASSKGKRLPTLGNNMPRGAEARGGCATMWEASCCGHCPRWSLWSF